MDPDQRQWWRLLDELPRALVAVHRWTLGRQLPGEDGWYLHPNVTSVVCLRGVVRITRPAGGDCDLQAGEALLIEAGVSHRHERLRRGTICFAQGFLPAWSDVRLGGPERDWTGRLPSEPSRMLMERALACPDDAGRLRLFADLAGQVLNESVTDHAFSGPALGRMIGRLWSGFHTGVTTADLIAASGLSRPQAYRLFTAGYGVPPTEAIARSRMWLAAALLEAGLPVAEVAARSGYPSAATFARAWKRSHGCAPRGWRPRRLIPADASVTASGQARNRPGGGTSG